MHNARQNKGRPQGNPVDAGLGRLEYYDRADEKRKIHEEIEDFLTERQEKKAPPQPETK